MKKLISFALVLVMVLGSATFAFADNSVQFTGETISLSLDQAIERMTTAGPAYDAVMLTKAGNDAAAKGNTEAISSIKAARKAVSDAKAAMDAGYITSDQYNAISAATAGVSMNSLTGKQLQLAKDYYTVYTPIAYEAGMNGIKKNVVNAYYGYLLAQENYKLNQVSTSIAKTTYDNTIKKYNLGTVAKMAVLQAENQYMQAQQKEAEALTALNTVRMSFNMAMGYDLMQDVKLTDSLVQVAGPSMTLDQAVESALANRNEILTAQYNMDNAQLKFNSVSAYPKNSATYLGAQVQLDGTKLAVDSTKTSIEMGLKADYMKIKDLENAITVAKHTYNNAKEFARLTQLQYDAGMCTLTDVINAQNTEAMANLGVASAVMNYDVAVYSFEYNSKYGIL